MPTTAARRGPPDLDARLAIEVADRLIQRAKLARAGTGQVIDPLAQREPVQPRCAANCSTESLAWPAGRWR